MSKPGEYQVDIAVTNPDGVTKTLSGDLTLSTSENPDPPDPPDPIDPIPPGDIGLTYIRTISLPSLYMAFAYGDLTGRIVDGKVRLIFTGDVPQGSPVYEVQVEEDTDAATFIQQWFQPYKTKRGSWMQPVKMIESSRRLKRLARSLHSESLHKLSTLYLIQYQKAKKEGKSEADWVYVDFDGGGYPVINSGHYYHAGLDLLFVLYLDSYNVSVRPDWNIVALRLNPDGTTEAFGPFRTVGHNDEYSSIYGGRIIQFLREHPETGEMIGGSTLTSGNASCTWGASLCGGVPFPDTSAQVGPGHDLIMPDHYLWHYYISPEIDKTTGICAGPVRSQRRPLDPYIFEPFGDVGGNQAPAINPAQYDGIGSWLDVDFIGSFVPLEDRVLYFASVGGSPIQDPNNPLACHSWYSTSWNEWKCYHGFDAVPVGITGPVSTARFPAAFHYPWSDLNRVKNGEAVDWQTNPTAWANLETQFGIVTAPVESIGNAKGNSAGFFNPETRRLYTIAHGADQGFTTWGLWNAYIHEWQVA